MTRTQSEITKKLTEHRSAPGRVREMKPDEPTHQEKPNRPMKDKRREPRREAT